MGKIERLILKNAIKNNTIFSAYTYLYLESVTFVSCIFVGVLIVGVTQDNIPDQSLVYSMLIFWSTAMCTLTLVFWKHICFFRLQNGVLIFRYVFPRFSFSVKKNLIIQIVQKNYSYKFDFEEIQEIHFGIGFVGILPHNEYMQHILFYTTPDWIYDWLKYHNFQGSIHHFGEIDI